MRSGLAHPPRDHGSPFLCRWEEWGIRGGEKGDEAEKESREAVETIRLERLTAVDTHACDG